jgi:tripartite-type tricarboxylate transporter receptor subunit TctC
MNHVPYKGSAPAMADVMDGHADMVMDWMLSSLPHVQTGKLRAIAITSAKRTAEMKAGIKEQGFDVLTGTPEQFTALLKTEISRWATAVKASGATAN